MEQVALNGFESVEKSTDAWGILSSKSYFVLKDVDLESLVAICKQTLKGVQVEFIEQDFNQRIKSYRLFFFLYKNFLNLEICLQIVLFKKL